MLQGLLQTFLNLVLLGGSLARNGPELYAYEKLVVALSSLATGAGDVRSRLYHAYLSFHTLKESDFPEHLRADFRWVLAQLTKFPPYCVSDGRMVRGSVEETLRRIKRSTGVAIAERVLHLYHEVESYVHGR
jgi:hypothetical protein